MTSLGFILCLCALGGCGEIEREGDTCHQIDSMMRENIQASIFSSALINVTGSSQLPKLSQMSFLTSLLEQDSHLSGENFFFLSLTTVFSGILSAERGICCCPWNLVIVALSTTEFDSQKVNLWSDQISESV